jgi:hypothetical protein
MKKKCLSCGRSAQMPRDAKQPDENLDVVRTSHDQEELGPKGFAGESRPDPHLSVVCPFPAQPSRRRKHRGPYRARGSKYISVSQAINIVEAVKFAKSIGLPLVAHATIHWSGTVAFDDPDGQRFAKVREGFHKYLLRRKLRGGLTGMWCRECKAHTDVVHCHLLFHLPLEYRSDATLLQIEAALFRLVGRHGGGILGEFAVKLKIWPDPDGLYLLKGGGPEVWKRFCVKKKFRESQGIIHGKRCGTTQNIGRAARALADEKKQRGAA